MNRRDFMLTTAGAALAAAVPVLPDLRPVRVYEFGGGDWWVAARCEADAVAVYNRDCGGGEADYAYELDGDDLAELTFRDHGEPDRTFAEELSRQLAAGQSVPFTLAASSYYG